LKLQCTLRTLHVGETVDAVRWQQCYCFVTWVVVNKWQISGETNWFIYLHYAWHYKCSYTELYTN